MCSAPVGRGPAACGSQPGAGGDQVLAEPGSHPRRSVEEKPQRSERTRALPPGRVLLARHPPSRGAVSHQAAAPPSAGPQKLRVDELAPSGLPRGQGSGWRPVCLLRAPANQPLCCVPGGLRVTGPVWRAQPRLWARPGGAPPAPTRRVSRPRTAGRARSLHGGRSASSPIERPGWRRGSATGSGADSKQLRCSEELVSPDPLLLD